MINYCEVAKETWETAKLRSKINLTFWVVYLAKVDGKTKQQDDYVIVDYFLDHPSEIQNGVFKQTGRKFKYTSSAAMQINFHVVWESILSQKPKVQTTKIKRMHLLERVE